MLLSSLINASLGELPRVLAAYGVAVLPEAGTARPSAARSAVMAVQGAPAVGFRLATGTVRAQGGRRQDR